MTLTITKRKGETLTLTEANSFIDNLYIRHNALRHTDVDIMTTGQFMFYDTDADPFYYYNYCGFNYADALNCNNAYSYKTNLAQPFVNIYYDLVNAIKKYEGS